METFEIFNLSVLTLCSLPQLEILEVFLDGRWRCGKSSLAVPWLPAVFLSGTYCRLRASIRSSDIYQALLISVTDSDGRFSSQFEPSFGTYEIRKLERALSFALNISSAALPSDKVN